MSYLHHGEVGYPSELDKHLGDRAPASMTLWGNRGVWFEHRGPLLGLFCSSRAPGTVILGVHDLAQRWRHGGPTVIGGFHSPVEREALKILLRGPRPVVACLARGLEGMRPKPEYKAPLAEGRLLLLSPFDASVRRITAKTSMARNRFVAALADAVLIAHAYPGSKTAALAEEVAAWGKPVYTLDHPSNGHLLSLGVEVFDQTVQC